MIGLKGAEGRLADLVSALAARETGRGPTRVAVHVDGQIVTLEFFGILTQLEKSLIKWGRGDVVSDLRERVVVDSMRPLWQDLFRREFGLNVTGIESRTDWERDLRTVIIHLA